MNTFLRFIVGLCIGTTALVAESYAQTFTSALPQSCTAVRGGSLTINFPNALPNANGAGTLSFDFVGDLNSSSIEYLQLTGETGGQIGANIWHISQCGQSNDSRQIPMADINAWAASGGIDFTFQASGSVDPICSGSSFCITATLTYPISTVPNDAGVTSVDSPSVFCAGTHDVKVTITNYGINQVNPVTVNWSIDGTLKTPITHSQLLDTAGGTGSTTAQINLGSHNFVAGVKTEIKAWTSKPNNQNDTMNINDTVTVTLQPSLSGTFTIDQNGTPSATTYTSFTSAVQDIVDFGVCGPVTFNVIEGTYNEQVSFDEFMGASTANMVTFQPDASNTMPVELTNSSSFSDNYTLRMNGADYVTFDDITLSALNTSYSRVVEFINGSSNNVFKNCVFDGANTSTSSNYAAVIYARAADNNYNEFIDNEVIGGSYSVYFWGSSISSHNVGTKFEGNMFKDAYYYSVYLYYCEGYKFNGNRIESASAATFGYGLYAAYGYNDVEVKNNHISWPGRSGMYMWSHDGTVSQHAYVMNNMVNSGNGTYYCYGMYFIGGFAEIAHNSIVKNASTNYGYEGIYVGGAANNVMNNMLYEAGGSGSYYALRYSGSYAVGMSDYNNIVKAGAFGYTTSAHATLADWQNATGFDTNSTKIDPMYSNYDSLRTCVDSLDNTGIALSFANSDIDGDGRHESTPDVGADEWIGSTPGSFSAGEDKFVCDGNPATIGLAGGGTYSWVEMSSPTNVIDTTAEITVSNAGTYIASVVTLCGATLADTVEVVEMTPVAQFDTSNSFRTGEFTNTSLRGETYLWDFGDGSTATTEHATHVFADNGPYTVCLTVYNDCDSATTCQVWEAYVGIEEFALNQAISLYPNPAKDVVTIDVSDVEAKQLTMIMRNVQGKTVETHQLRGAQMQTIDVSALPNGVYFVQFLTEEHTVTKRLVIQ